MDRLVYIHFPFDSDDCKIALHAAESMSRRFRCDVVILFDLSIKLSSQHRGEYLEKVRFLESIEDTK